MPGEIAGIGQRAPGNVDSLSGVVVEQARRAKKILAVGDLGEQDGKGVNVRLLQFHVDGCKHHRTDGRERHTRSRSVVCGERVLM